MINNLKIARQVAGYTQSELAYICKVKRETIVRLENGKNIPNAALLLKLEYILHSLFIYDLDKDDIDDLNSRINRIYEIQKVKADNPGTAERR